MMNRFRLGTLVLSVGLIAPAVEAQSLGTFRWQLQPFCNVVTVIVTQQGAVYTTDGTTISAEQHSVRLWSGWPRPIPTARSASE